MERRLATVERTLPFPSMDRSEELEVRSANAERGQVRFTATGGEQPQAVGGVAAARAEAIAGREAVSTARSPESKKRLEQVVAASGTTVIDIFGVGPVVAATVVGLTGDIARFPTRDRFAAFNGTAPIEVSSGGRKVWRLPARRGNRALNHTMHMAAIRQIRFQVPATHPAPRGTSATSTQDGGAAGTYAWPCAWVTGRGSGAAIGNNAGLWTLRPGRIFRSVHYPGSVGLVLDLAEAINIGWGEVAGQGRESLRDRLTDRNFRKQVVNQLASDVPSARGSPPLKVLRSAGFRKWFESAGKADLSDHLTDRDLRSLGVTDETTASDVGRVVGEAIAAIAFDRADWVQRELLRRTGESTDLGYSLLHYLEDIWSLLANHDLPQEIHQQVLERSTLHRRISGLANGV